jgi:hypothetical protein
MNPSFLRPVIRSFFSNAVLEHLQRLREPNRMRRPSGRRYQVPVHMSIRHRNA